MDDDGRLSIDGRMSRFSGSVRDFDEMSSHSGSSSLLSAQGNLVTKMASEKFADPEVLRTCPFDPVHVVQGPLIFSLTFSNICKAYRYQRHILRCRQQNPEKAKNHHQCKYNGMHWIHKHLMEDHLKDCPDRNRCASVSLLFFHINLRVSIKSRFRGLQRPLLTDR